MDNKNIGLGPKLYLPEAIEASYFRLVVSVPAVGCQALLDPAAHALGQHLSVLPHLLHPPHQPLDSAGGHLHPLTGLLGETHIQKCQNLASFVRVCDYRNVSCVKL